MTDEYDLDGVPGVSIAAQEGTTELELRGATPNEELRALIKEWRETAAMQHPEESEEFNIRCDVWEKAAGELEALLQE